MTSATLIVKHRDAMEDVIVDAKALLRRILACRCYGNYRGSSSSALATLSETHYGTTPSILSNLGDAKMADCCNALDAVSYSFNSNTKCTDENVRCYIIEKGLAKEDLGDLDRLSFEEIKRVIEYYLSFDVDTYSGHRTRKVGAKLFTSAGTLGLHFLLHGRPSATQLANLQSCVNELNSKNGFGTELELAD